MADHAFPQPRGPIRADSDNTMKLVGCPQGLSTLENSEAATYLFSDPSRSTLALAVFIAHLERDPDRAKRIRSSTSRPESTGRSLGQPSPTISRATFTSARPARCWLPPALW